MHVNLPSSWGSLGKSRLSAPNADVSQRASETYLCSSRSDSAPDADPTFLASIFPRPRPSHQLHLQTNSQRDELTQSVVKEGPAKE